jgi:hypothetical protein
MRIRGFRLGAAVLSAQRRRRLELPMQNYPTRRSFHTTFNVLENLRARPSEDRSDRARGARAAEFMLSHRLYRSTNGRGPDGSRTSRTRGTGTTPSCGASTTCA